MAMARGRTYQSLRPQQGLRAGSVEAAAPRRELAGGLVTTLESDGWPRQRQNAAIDRTPSRAQVTILSKGRLAGLRQLLCYLAKQRHLPAKRIAAMSAHQTEVVDHRARPHQQPVKLRAGPDQVKR